MLSPEVKEYLKNFVKSLGLSENNVIFTNYVSNDKLGEREGKLGLTRPEHVPKGKGNKRHSVTCSSHWTSTGSEPGVAGALRILAPSTPPECLANILPDDNFKH